MAWGEIQLLLAGSWLVFLAICRLNEVGWGRVLRIRDCCVRFGERFSYCDPQIPASVGVWPCVCFSVSWVEFSGRLLLVVLGSLWCFWRSVRCPGSFGDLSIERGRLGKSPVRFGTVAFGLGKDSVTVIPRLPPRRGFGRASVSRYRGSNSPAGFSW